MNKNTVKPGLHRPRLVEPFLLVLPEPTAPYCCDQPARKFSDDPEAQLLTGGGLRLRWVYTCATCRGWISLPVANAEVYEAAMTARVAARLAARSARHAAEAWVRVLVTGSRAWTDPAKVIDVLTQVHYGLGERLVLVHGACRGVDLLAERWASRTGVAIERYPANWERYGRAAGLVRNAVMVATRPNLCLAFIRDNSAGATHCATTAQKAGIPVRYYRDGDAV